MYPSIQPHHKTWLHTDTLQNGKKVLVYLECCGNPNGIPVIYLHGGPGDHIVPRLRRLYDPKVYHILLFDQSGCGESKPRAHTEKNTTKHLISDMEKIREYVKADKMIVAGGSWGSSLAMLYAQAHPERVSGLILRGVYDLSKIDVLDEMYPEQEDDLNGLLGLHHPSNNEQYKTIKKVLSGKTKKRRKVIKILSSDEPMFVMTKMKKPNTFKQNETMTIIGEHYDSNDYFVPKRTIYTHMHLIEHIPTIMVEGRYDMVTPMKIAYKLSKLFKKCKLMIVPAGHTAYEENITTALIKASTLMQRLYLKN